MYTIEEYDKEKSKVLKYVLYKKRSKKEVQNKFYNIIENEMLHDIIEELEENGYIDDNNYIERAINEFMALNNLSLKEVRYKLMSKGKGLDEKTVQNILKIKPVKLVYISCNPATMVRNIAKLEEVYEVKKIQPVDMFPYTSHVECVTVLQLKQDM